MRKFRTQPPYNKDGKTNFRYTAGKSGVYLIYKNGSLVYVGMSKTNVYRTMYRHFQKWDDPSQVRVTYNPRSTRNAFSCRVVLCTPLQAENLEKVLIRKHKPKDNPNKYLTFTPTAKHTKAIQDFIGTPVESCPF